MDTVVNSNALTERWNRAQLEERVFWDEVVGNGAEFLRITVEKLRCIELVRKHVPQALETASGGPREVVEIGIGPIAVGVGSLLDPPDAWHLTGVEPQARRSCIFPDFIMAGYRILQDRPLNYVHARGEATGLPGNSFDLAFCFNVIDHTPNWRGILTEIHRLLKPGAYFVLTVDVLCAVSYLRWAWFLRWFRKNDPNIVAHPARFTAFKLERLLPQFSFENRYVERHRDELRKRMIGRWRRMTVVAQKPLHNN